MSQCLSNGYRLMNRRRFFNFGFKAVIAGLAGIMGLKAESSVAFPASVFEVASVEQILNQLFETNDVGEDARIHIHVPREAEHRALVPFRIVAPGAERIAVMVDNNPQPLVMTMDIVGNANGVMMGTLKMKTASYISCYAMKQGQLSRAARWVRIAERGYDDQ